MMPNKTLPTRRCSPPHRPRHQAQRGIAMLEVLGALAIGAALIIGLSAVVDTSLEDVKGQQAAYYQSQIAEGARKYIAAHVSDLQTILPSATSRTAVGLADLIAGKFVPAATGSANVYGQLPCLVVRQPDPISKPGQFDALLVTLGGDAIPEKTLAMIAANAGPSGGYISTQDATNAKGASWSTSTEPFRSASCASAGSLSGGAGDGGRLASNLFFDGPGQLATDFLYRSAVPGRPELNQMNTPIRMANAALVSLGTSCVNAAGSPEAGMAIDSATRGILTCSAAGVWDAPSQWKDPVESHGDLLAVAGSQRGDVRMVNDLSRAFTYDGSTWRALAVDENNNMTVPGTLTAGNVHTTQNMVADGTIQAAGDISTSSSVSAGLDVNASRDVKATRDVNATRDVISAHNVVTQGLEVDRWASSPAISIGINFFTAGQACHYMENDPYEGYPHIVYPVGTIVMDANYVPLICGVDHTMRYANGTYTP